MIGGRTGGTMELHCNLNVDPTLGKGEVNSSILLGGTTKNPRKIGLFCYNRRCSAPADSGQFQHERGQNMTANWGKPWGKMFPSRCL